MDRTTQILSTCLNISLGTLPEISRKPKIWQKSFREASPRFYEQTTQANFGFVWLNRNILWCQTAPLMTLIILMNLAISSNSDIFCFGGSDKEMKIMNQNFIIHSKQKIIKSKVPLGIRTVGQNWNFPVVSWDLDVMVEWWTSPQERILCKSKPNLYIFISYNKPGIHTLSSHLLCLC